LSLPFFVAGLIALLFGVRRLWMLKSSVLFLFFAWPVPYGVLLATWLDAFTTVTAQAVHAVSAVLSIGRSGAADGTVIFIDHGGSSFPVNIGSACSGVNGLVGFLLLGIALMLLVRGTAPRRLAWLGAGLAIIWILNIARIELVLMTGEAFGSDVAFDVLHPVAGLLVFNVGVIATMWLVPRFGLRFAELPDEPAKVPTSRTRNRLRTASVMAVGLAVAAAAGAVNGGYARYEQITGDLGTARLVRFDVRTAQIPGWSAGFVESVGQARQFFGADARWDRLIYRATASARLRSSVPIYVDVIDTDDAGALAAYTVADCYQFHHFRIDAQLSVDIGAGVTGQVVTYFDPKDRSDWSAISWEWPKEYDGKLRYERIVVFVPDSNSVAFAGFDEAAPVSGDATFHDTQQFLATAARNIVRGQLDAATAARRMGD
jgi:exosortase/archaeosortase family protein